MNRPATTDGRPLMASTNTRTGRRRRLRVSLRNTAVDTARGTVNARARPTCSRLPTMACEPPPLVGGSRGLMPDWSFRKKSKRSDGAPSVIT
jgi:hypothetical protein